MNPSKKTLALALFFVPWALLLLLGFHRLFAYSGAPGPLAISSPQWPQSSTLAREPGLSTLVLFVHPRCPCSSATLGELERLIPFTLGKVKNYVVFVKPSSRSDEWVHDGLWQKAKALPEVKTVLDAGGVEAGRFGAKTSGQAFLFAPDGELIFHGGITPARGHMGDSDGRRAILAFAKSGEKSSSTAHVFGCSLVNPNNDVAEVDHAEAR